MSSAPITQHFGKWEPINVLEAIKILGSLQQFYLTFQSATNIYTVI